MIIAEADVGNVIQMVFGIFAAEDSLECYTYTKMERSVIPTSFASLETEWQELLATSTANHIFFTSQWQKAWWQVFGGDYESFLLSIIDNGKLVGIAPLKRKDGKISFIGSSDVCDYMDFIAQSGQEEYVFSRLIDYLDKNEWSTIEFDSVLPDSLALKFFVPLAQQKGYQISTTQTNVSPQLVLPSSRENYISSLNAKDRHEIRRKIRRLEQIQSVNYFTITEKERMPGAAESFFKLFRLSNGEKAGFMTDKKREFFSAMISSLAEHGNIRLSFMEIGANPASSTLCFDYNNDIYLYNSAFDRAYSALSASLLLEVYNIWDAINNGKKRFDFLSGNEPYKYDLGGRDVPLYHCVVSRS